MDFVINSRFNQIKRHEKSGTMRIELSEMVFVQGKRENKNEFLNYQ